MAAFVSVIYFYSESDKGDCPIKIAFFNKDLPSNAPNGVSCQVHRLANALVDRGHTVTCFSFSPAPIDARYSVVTLPVRARGKLMRKFEPALRFRSLPVALYDILHFHGDDYLVYNRANRVRTFYGSALSEALHARKAIRFLYQGLFYGLEWISCISRGVKTGISRTTSRALPCVKTIIPCGVPVDRFTPAGIKTENPSLLFVGDFKSRKRGNDLLHLFTYDILPAYPACTLTVVGPKACAGPNIHYAGVVSEEKLIAEYRKAWCYCMPSSYEGFGVPVIEAMACGTPVVAVKNSGSMEIINNGHDGMLVPRSQLAAGIRTVLADATLRKTLECNGRKKVETVYSTARCAELYEALYKQLLKGI